MTLLDKLAEERIAAAMQRGDFLNLPGAGLPIPQEDFSFIPEEKRMAYKILKNSGYVPPELELHSEIYRLESIIRQNCEEVERRKYLKKLHYLFTQLDERGEREVNLVLQNEYYEKILSRLAGT